MSETVLKIIPTDQNYVPSLEQQEKALALLRKMAPFGMHEARVYDDLTFIDQGEYCEAVLCPSCGGRVAVDPFSGSDLAQAWYHAIDEAIIAGTPVRTLKTTMPCCGASVSFASLQFHSPAGFADGETATPSALAVVSFTYQLEFGRLLHRHVARLAPCRILSTYSAARRNMSDSFGP